MSSARIQRRPPPVVSNGRFVASRRKFMLQCSAVAALAAVPASLSRNSPSARREVSLDRLGFATFARLVRTRFEVRGEVGTVRLALVEASAGRDDASRQLTTALADPEEFSLLFRGAEAQFLRQGSYEFEHRQIGRFVMFIVPVGIPDATGGRYYEAVFNRSAEAATQTASIYG